VNAEEANVLAPMPNAKRKESIATLKQVNVELGRTLEGLATIRMNV
jgi:hypothetical protein